MSTIEILNTPSYTLVYHEDGGIIHHTLKPPMGDEDTSDTYKGKVVTKWHRLLSTGSDVLREKKATRWIADNRVMLPVPEDDANWIQNTWIPSTLASGWKYWALVVPETLVGQADMVKYVESVHKTGVKIAVYATMDAAFKWLRSRPD